MASHSSLNWRAISTPEDNDCGNVESSSPAGELSPTAQAYRRTTSAIIPAPETTCRRLDVAFSTLKMAVVDTGIKPRHAPRNEKQAWSLSQRDGGLLDPHAFNRRHTPRPASSPRTRTWKTCEIRWRTRMRGRVFHLVRGCMLHYYGAMLPGRRAARRIGYAAFPGNGDPILVYLPVRCCRWSFRLSRYLPSYLRENTMQVPGLGQNTTVVLEGCRGRWIRRRRSGTP